MERPVVVVCGSRYWKDWPFVLKMIREVNPIEIIEGEANGADRMGRWAGVYLGIKVTPVKADWDKLGPAAGPERNDRMIKMKPDMVLAFHNSISSSKGTKDMIDRAKAAGIPFRLMGHM